MFDCCCNESDQNPAMQFMDYNAEDDDQTSYPAASAAEPRVHGASYGGSTPRDRLPLFHSGEVFLSQGEEESASTSFGEDWNGESAAAMLKRRSSRDGLGDSIGKGVNVANRKNAAAIAAFWSSTNSVGVSPRPLVKPSGPERPKPFTEKRNGTVGVGVGICASRGGKGRSADTFLGRSAVMRGIAPSGGPTISPRNTNGVGTAFVTVSKPKGAFDSASVTPRTTSPRSVSPRSVSPRFAGTSPRRGYSTGRGSWRKGQAQELDLATTLREEEVRCTIGAYWHNAANSAGHVAPGAIVDTQTWLGQSKVDRKGFSGPVLG